MPPMLLVFNPRARGAQVGCSPEVLETALAFGGRAIERIPCDGEETTERLRAAIAAGAREVVVAGGDGTVHRVANLLVGTGVTLGVIPCGTGNDFARALGLPLDPLEAVRVIQAGNERVIDLGWVNGRYFLNVAALGLAADVASTVEPSTKRRWGRWAYVCEVVRRAGHHRPRRFKFCMEGSCERLDAYQISIANSGCFGGGYRVVAEPELEEGLLDVVVIEPGWRKILSGAIQGQTLVEKLGSRHYRTPSLEVSCPGRISLNLDGETLEFDPPLMFKAVPHSLTVYAGRPREGAP